MRQMLIFIYVAGMLVADDYRRLLKLARIRSAKEYYDTWETLKNTIVDFVASSADLKLLEWANSESHDKLVFFPNAAACVAGQFDDHSCAGQGMPFEEE